MPVIELGPEGDGLAMNRIWAVMLYPNDAKRRSGFLEICRRLAPLREGYFYRPGRPQARGTRAGEALAYVYRMEKFHPECKPSLGKAFYLIDKTVSQGIGAYNLDGTRVRAAAAHVRKTCWGKYRSVAHLWAAWRLYADYATITWGSSERELMPLWGFLVGNFKDFLGLAEIIRKFGESYSTYPDQTLLSPGRTWCAPAGLELLKSEDVALPLHPRELELLDGYEAKIR